MLEHLLVPLDGSGRSELVLAQVRRLVRLGASRITLFRAELPVALDDYAAISEVARAQARKYLEGVRRSLSDLEVRVEVRSEIGAPASAIVEAAEASRATLVVIAAARRSRLSRFLFGSVPEEVVRRCPVPVLVVPDPWASDTAPAESPEEQEIRTVLVPLNGDAASGAVLPPAIEIARKAQARLLLVGVLEPQARSRSAFSLADEAPARDEFEGAEEQLYAAGAQCAVAGVDFSVLVEYGDPSDRILSVCRERSVDWVAMATRGRSGFARWFQPSATERVLRQSSLPVLTVRTEASAPSVRHGVLSVSR